jgi:hypothetical protein
MQDRRSEPRMLCADMIEVQWKAPRGPRRLATALLEDISPSGACLQLEFDIPVGSEIRWKFLDREFGGRVCYCAYREIGYFVGVEFTPGRKWSPSAYAPQHLLDINKLLKH